jgi:hypothetical protein
VLQGERRHHHTCNRWLWGIAALSASLWLHAGPSSAAEPVDVELVIAMDVSASMDGAERQVQLKGFADAFSRPEIVAAIQGGRHGRIAVTVFEWGGPGLQTVIVPWRLVDGEASSAALSQALARRVPGRLNRGTAIGDALRNAATLLAESPYRGDRRVVDLSGDGTSNRGTSVGAAKALLLGSGVTINGLPVAYSSETASTEDSDEPTLRPEILVRYFETEIIGGPGAFVEPVLSPDSYSAAIRRKLLREIGGGAAVAGSSAPPRRDQMADAGPVER